MDVIYEELTVNTMKSITVVAKTVLKDTMSFEDVRLQLVDIAHEASMTYREVAKLAFEHARRRAGNIEQSTLDSNDVYRQLKEFCDTHK